MRKLFLYLSTACLAVACTTVPNTQESTDPVAEAEKTAPSIPVVVAEPLTTPPPAPIVRTSAPIASEPPPEPVIETPKLSGFEALPFWGQHDARPALSAFVRGCTTWSQSEPEALLNPNLPQYGRYKDWSQACQSAAVLDSVAPSAIDVRNYFESWFAPVSLATHQESDGLLTGYYEPEVEVRINPDATFSEPILSKPKSTTTLKLPRKDVNAFTSRVIAYGRPIDVFFLQIQGSGRLKYSDGRILRAAYAGNNGHKYRSIGSVLIQRGELTREQSSKQSIANWMERNGPAAARELMNQNPQGAMRVPLTAMGAIAVDPRYHPYGSLFWLETTLPTQGGVFRGQSSGRLVTAQDTGSAIKGPLRGDLFFGSGAEAGDRAGVQKHRASWTLLLPRFMAGTTES